jgi:hypothetical protein
MSSTPVYYTDLFPKRGDITSSNNQAFGKGEDVLIYIIGWIKANTITAIGTITLGTTTIQYLFTPKIHHDLGGIPKMIVRNVSNKLGEFSCGAMPLLSFKLFSCITSKTKVDGMLPYELDFENDVLVNADWHDSGTSYVGLILPNFFIIYFGQKPPTGDITSEDVNMAFLNVRMGYRTCCIFAEEAINASCKIETVLHCAEAKDDYDHVAFVKKYFC